MAAKRAPEIEASFVLIPAAPIGSGKPRLVSHATPANGRQGGVCHIGTVVLGLRNAAVRAGAAAGSGLPWVCWAKLEGLLARLVRRNYLTHGRNCCYRVRGRWVLPLPLGD